jgi:hypothetical protein
MTSWQAIGLAVVIYLVLLARSAWMQGEFRQFLWSLVVVAGLCAGIAAAVALAVWLENRAA